MSYFKNFKKCFYLIKLFFFFNFFRSKSNTILDFHFSAATMVKYRTDVSFSLLDLIGKDLTPNLTL